jgi:hypothetical protein
MKSTFNQFPFLPYSIVNELALWGPAKPGLDDAREFFRGHDQIRPECAKI